jgi:hypothetical protein
MIETTTETIYTGFALVGDVTRAQATITCAGKEMSPFALLKIAEMAKKKENI